MWKLPAALLFALAPSLLFSGTELTPLEQRGRAIYRTGVSPAGTEISAVLSENGIDMPAAAFPCAGCHGRDGRGRPEGGLSPSDLRWASLTKPYGVTHPGGRKHPAYDDRSLKRAIAMGIDAGGNKLHVAMPRFRMTQEDMAALLAYMKRLGTEAETGVSETGIRVGVLLPPAGPLAGMGKALQAALGAKIADLNGAGGIYGRKLELVFAEATAAPAARRAQVAELLDEQEIFAFLGAFLAGADRELADLFAEREVPLIGPFTLHPNEALPLNRQVFYLLSGVETQARVLARAALAGEGEAGRPRTFLVVAPGGEAFDAAVTELEKELAKSPGRSSAAVARYPRPGFEPPAVVRRLAEQKAEAVIFLGSGGELAALAAAADRAGLHPRLFATGAASDGDLLAVPAAFDGRVVLALPALERPHPTYPAFAAAHHLPQEHLSAQWTALAAVEILAEALRRAGRDLTRDSLIERLEEFQAFNTGYAPPLTYNAGRRIGARGAYLLRLDLAARTLSPMDGWVDIN